MIIPPMTLTLLTPDDWHCHLRDDAYLKTTVPFAAQQFSRVIVMPNLSTPVMTASHALAYHERIVSHVPSGAAFTPLMTLYLTDEMTPAMIATAALHRNIIIGAKLYPAHVTTHSAHGVTNITALYPVFDRMQYYNMPLLIHGEVNDPNIDIFDREAVFIDTLLIPLVRDFPELKIVLEHITTRHAVDFIRAQSSHVAATITPHHLYANRNALLVGGLHPHYYCLPILKRHEDQQALIQAATSGSPQFFIGTDSAPHSQESKESACGCAGIFHTHAMSIYAQIFEEHHALDKLEDFCSRWGAQFYNLSISTSYITLEKSPCFVPLQIPYGDGSVLPFLYGETLAWHVRIVPQ